MRQRWSGAIARRTAFLAALLAACVDPAPHAERWWDAPTPMPTAVEAPQPSSAARPSCEVDVLESEPAVPFDLLGVVEVQGQGPAEDPEGVLRAARLRACQLGGDALVVLFRREGRRGGLPRPAEGRGLLPEPEIRAAVIRYR